ncbi:MAG: hypothetical protein AAFQ71_10825 [Planctomycetota bacterium]
MSTTRNGTSLIDGRTCGECRACCVAPDIPELGKPRDTPCPRLHDAGRSGGQCSVYGSRPEVCRSFECAWLSGLGSERDRPDRLGVLMQPITMPDGGPGLGMVELRRGALEQPRVKSMVRDFDRTKPGRVVLRRFQEARFQALTVEGAPPLELKPHPSRPEAPLITVVAGSLKPKAPPRRA